MRYIKTIIIVSCFPALLLVLNTPLMAAGESSGLNSVFQKERSDKADVIYFRNNEVLRGKVVNKTISINTPYGLLDVPLWACAGVSFEGSRFNMETLVTNNLNRFSGIITNRVIQFETVSPAITSNFRKEKIKYILFQKKPQTSEQLNPRRKTDLFIMTNGDLLTGEPLEKSFNISTGYADIPVTYEETQYIEMQDGANANAVVKKKNGDVMRGAMATEEITLNLDIGINVEAVYKSKFAKIFLDDGNHRTAMNFDVMQSVDGTHFAVTGEETITNSIGMTFKLIKPGSFMMGSPRNEAKREIDEVLHKVTLTKGFYIQTTEVTQAQWAALMKNNPSFFYECGHECPVESVSWSDVHKFINQLNEKEYGRRYRLPTEAEWEYAARAGTSTAYSFGKDSNKLKDYAWYNGNADKIQPVAGKKPNAWGLYDMYGNVWEWCQDWYGDYLLEDVEEPWGPSDGLYRVKRGGSWVRNASRCRSAFRDGFKPGFRYYDLGFRLAFSPSHQAR